VDAKGLHARWEILNLEGIKVDLDEISYPHMENFFTRRGETSHLEAWRQLGG
jgi:hypothetical protein